MTLAATFNCPDCGAEVKEWTECWQTLFGEDVWRRVAICRGCDWSTHRRIDRPTGQ